MRASPKYEREKKKRVSTSLNNLVRNSQKIVSCWLFIATQQHDDDYVYNDDDYDVGLFIYIFLYFWIILFPDLLVKIISFVGILQVWSSFFIRSYICLQYSIYKQFFDNNRMLNTHFRFQVKCIL